MMKKNNNQISLFIQFVLIICAIILLVMGLFENTFFLVSRVIWIFAALVMSYNNQFYFKRKLFTLFYILFAIILALPLFGIEF